MTVFLLDILLALAGLTLSALFSGLETGMYTINRVRLAVRAGRRERRARRVRAMLDDPESMLATILVGNNVANYAGTLGVAAILERLGVDPLRAILINAGLLIPLIFVFGETLPKDLFRTHTDRWTYTLSGFLTTCATIFTWTGLTPLVRGFGRAVAWVIGTRGGTVLPARQRMAMLIKEAVTPGVLTEAQTTLVDRALTLRDRTVAMEMVPWREVDVVSADADIETVRRMTRRRNRSRLPMVDGRGNVVGVLTVLDALLRPDEAPRELAEPPLDLPRELDVRTALTRMRRERRAVAIVRSRDGTRPAGMVTIKDLVEPLTGELQAW
jgi:CBS domain containing-hemolysin-like protein